MTWKTSGFDTGTVGTAAAAGDTVIDVTGAAANWVGRFIFFEPGEVWVDAAVVVAVSGSDVTIDKGLRGPLLVNDAAVLSEDAEAGEAAGDYAEDSNAQQRAYSQKSQISLTSTGTIGFVGIRTNTLDIAQSTTSGPYLLEGTGRQCLGLSSMQFNTQTGGSTPTDGNEVVAIGDDGTFWAINTSFHSITNSIFRMTGEGQCWWENVVNIGMTRIELRGEVWWTNVFLEGRENSLDIVEIDLPTAGQPNISVQMTGITMKNMNGFGNQVTTSEDHLYVIANCIFLNPSPRIVRIEEGRQWVFLNTLFNETLTSSNVVFATTGIAFLKDKLAVIYDIVDLAGTQIASAVLYVHSTGGTDSIDTYGREILTSNLFETATTRVSIEANPTWTATTFSGFFVKAARYNYQPVIIPLADVETAQTLTGLLTLADEPWHDAATAALAITAGAGTTFTHIPTLDTYPMQVLNYDAGTGGLPTFGETITCGTATGTLVEIIGDAASGTIVLENWNNVAFPDNTAMTGGTSTFAVTSDTASFYESYSWLVDGAGTRTLQQVFDYTMSVGWEGAQPEFQKWANADNAGYLLRTTDGVTFFTKRNTTRNSGEGVWVSRVTDGTKITTMEADDGTVFTYPALFTMTINVKDAAGANLQNVRVLVETAATAVSGEAFEATISTITRSGTTATATTAAAHNLTNGNTVVIRGAQPDGYNKAIAVIVTGATTFTYTVDSGLSTPATGTPIVSFVAISGLTDASGNIAVSRQWSDAQNFKGTARKSTTAPFYKFGAFTFTMPDDADNLTNVVLQLDQ